VRFEADIDLAAGTGKCNCSYCTKSRNWNVILKPADFSPRRGRGRAHRLPVRHQAGPPSLLRSLWHHAFSRGDIPEIGGAFVSVQLASLDDVTPAEIIAAPVHVSNGRDNDWMHPPAETRHL
jgi:hypothetical protein